MKQRSVKKLASAVVAVLMGIFFALDPTWMLMLEYRAQDAAFQRAGMPHPDIVVVGIDERALAQFGPFGQWPRSLMAEAIQILNTYEDERPAVIAVDVLFSGEGHNTEADAALAQAARDAGNVMMASRIEVGFDPQALTLDLTPIALELPFPALMQHVEHGLVNGVFDRDGFVRNAILWERFNGDIHYAFAVVAAAMYLGVEPGEVHPFIGSYAETYIRYTGMPGSPGDFFQLSFADIFAEDFEPWWWADTIMMIGPYAAGMMDHYPVPIDHSVAMYGVEIHANILQQVLEGNFAHRAPDWVRITMMITLLAVGMLLGELLDIRVLLAVFLAMAAVCYLGAQWMFEHQGYVLPILIPVLTLGLVFIYQMTYGYVLHSVEKSKMRSMFKKYVDPKLVDNLIESGEADSDAVGRKKHIAVMFVDVRGFTPMTESLRDTPEVIVETLNEYLELTSSAVFNNGGSVDKFIGDATMALFNGFVPQDDYVFKAVKAAWEMIEGATSVNASLKERLGVDVGFGVGVHCGEAIVGNLGPSFRKDYTAIGDAVNTAARLESNAKRSQVLISSDVYEILKGRIECESIGEIPLKGKSVPMEVFALTGIKS
ncbi:MAG: adenylate/guanylate cyclase domain-containing protein [Defluviitaleaceae bacterium]|nr:adenylate/guanylate cyclase domain-containing protein [Defluviitaleaceae bacterium]